MKAPAFSLIFLIAATLRADPPLVRVSTLDGTQFEAKWTGISADGQFSFSLSEANKTLSQEDLTQIVLIHSKPPEKSSGGCDVIKANGDRLMGSLSAKQNGSADAINLQMSAGRMLQIPMQSISAVRLGDSRNSHEKEFAERVAARVAGRDVLLLIRDGRLTALPGALESLNSSECVFRINDKPRTIAVRDVYGVIFGSVPAAAEPMPATIELAQGSRIGAKIIKGSNDRLHVDAGGMGKLEFDWNEITRLDFQSGRVTFISDLQPDIRESPGIMDAVWPVNLDKSTLGGPIRIHGRSFAKGIGMHANASVTFKLDGQYERFNAIIGIDDDAASAGSVVFEVKVDGESKYASPVLGGTAEPMAISVEVLGARSITLQADMADDLDISDHADWANAILIRKK